MDRRLPGAVPAGAATVLLLATGPRPADAVRSLGDAAQAADPTAPLVALAALLAWLLVGWLLVVGAVTEAGRLPGRAGRTADRLASRIAPPAVRRAVALALGVTIAAGPLGTAPAAADDRPAGPGAVVTRSLDWPTLTVPPSGQEPAPAPAGSSPAAVVVQPGECLWTVTARALGGSATDEQVARAWPAWWAANRAAIGADPNLIHPGLRLDPPTRP